MLVGFISNILSWRGWGPLGKLTFSVYLIHPLVIFIYLSNRRDLNYLEDFSVVSQTSYFLLELSPLHIQIFVLLKLKLFTVFIRYFVENFLHRKHKLVYALQLVLHFFNSRTCIRPTFSSHMLGVEC